MLGLAPPNATSSSYSDGGQGVQPHSNFLYELMSSGTMEHNTMTLSIPRSLEAFGKLQFGAVPSQIDHRIPMSRTSEPQMFAGSWAVSLDRIVLNSAPQEFAVSVNLTVSKQTQSGHIFYLLWCRLPLFSQKTNMQERGLLPLVQSRSMRNSD